MLEIKEITTRSGLQALSDKWNDFLSSCGISNIFMTWEWISEWVDIYLKEGQLKCLVIYDDGKLAGIVPLWINKTRFCGIIGLRTLCLLGSEEVCPDHMDFIIRRKNRQAIISAVWEYLFGQIGKSWDLFKMHDMLWKSFSLNEFYKFADEDDRCIRRMIQEYSVCPYIPLPESWDEYMANLSSNQRRLYRATDKKLEEKGEIQFAITRDAESLDKEMEKLKELNSRSWEERGQPGSFSTTRFEEFHRRFSKRLLEKGQLLQCSLRLSGKLIGSYYGFLNDNKSYFYVIGIERDIIKGASVGRALLGRCIRESIERGCTEFDLLRGDEQYKFDWTDKDRKNLCLNIHNRSFRSFLFILYSFSSDFLKQVFKRLLGKRYKSVKKVILRTP